MKTLTVSFLVLLMVSGPIALFLTITRASIVATSVPLQKQLMKFWFTFAAALCGLLVYLAGFSSPLETVVGVVGSIALFQFIVSRINLSVPQTGTHGPTSSSTAEKTPLERSNKA